MLGATEIDSVASKVSVELILSYKQAKSGLDVRRTIGDSNDLVVGAQQKMSLNLLSAKLKQQNPIERRIR